MIHLMIFLLGGLLVLVILYDFLRTTISLSGLGFISRVICNSLWAVGAKLCYQVERNTGVSIRGLLGPLILVAMAITWVMLHLTGYVMMFYSGSSLTHPDTGEPATLIQIIAFSGSALSTLGASTVEVTTGWWNVLSMIAAVNGMIVLTLSVSFLLNILQTTNSARTFAARFHALKSIDSDTDLLQRVEKLGPDLFNVVVQLIASPLPGVFVPSDPLINFPRAIAELCDLIEADPGADTSELKAAVALLGRCMQATSGPTDLEAARAWAEYYTIRQVEALDQQLPNQPHVT